MADLLNVMIIILKQSFIKVFTMSPPHQSTRKMLLSDSKS